jgi:hypothetical protein
MPILHTSLGKTNTQNLKLEERFAEQFNLKLETN